MPTHRAHRNLSWARYSFVVKLTRQIRPLLLATTALCSLPCATAAAQAVAFTWDDLPAHSALPPGQTRLEIAQSILKAMKDKNLPPAYGFVNGSFMEHEPGTEAVLKAWRAAGLPLGNHTWSHMNLNSSPVEAWEQDLQRNEPLLRQYAAGADWHWLRYPYLAEGHDEKRTEARAFLKAQGYHVASVTMSFGDWAWNTPYARCVQNHDEAAIANLEASYLKAADDTITYTRDASKAVFGHDIPYVLLMHVGALDAKLLPRLLALYQQRGFRFITLEEAESDPFYATDRNIVPEAGPATIEAAAAAKGIKLPPHPALPKMDDLCK